MVVVVVLGRGGMTSRWWQRPVSLPQGTFPHGTNGYCVNSDVYMKTLSIRFLHLPPLYFETSIPFYIYFISLSWITLPQFVILRSGSDGDIFAIATLLCGLFAHLNVQTFFISLIHPFGHFCICNKVKITKSQVFYF